HAVKTLVGCVAARLSGLRCLKSLIGSALGAGSSLARLVGRALGSIGGIGGRFGGGSDFVKLLGGDGSTTGDDCSTAEECRRSQSALELHGHRYPLSLLSKQM